LTLANIVDDSVLDVLWF